MDRKSQYLFGKGRMSFIHNVNWLIMKMSFLNVKMKHNALRINLKIIDGRACKFQRCWLTAFIQLKHLKAPSCFWSTQSRWFYTYDLFFMKEIQSSTILDLWGKMFFKIFVIWFNLVKAMQTRRKVMMTQFQIDMTN